MSSRFCFSCEEVLRLSRAASVAILPSALSCERLFRSVQVGRPQFSRRCYLIIDLGCRGVGQGLGRSHLDSAVELGSSDATSMLLRFPLGGCSTVAHRLPRSPTTCAVVRARFLAFSPPRSASLSPSAADHCPVQRARECSGPLGRSGSSAAAKSAGIVQGQTVGQRDQGPHAFRLL